MAHQNASVEVFHDGNVVDTEGWQARWVFWDQYTNDLFHSSTIKLHAHSQEEALTEAAQQLGVQSQFVHLK
ncbi:hypothetical protein [Ferrimonas pelagia]|uniref:Uncharacterized protein n=1 Tax=Ferrimonas pelagia TaxID=1177826 RepID=A0ABP9EF27_9GAMM